MNKNTPYQVLILSRITYIFVLIVTALYKNIYSIISSYFLIYVYFCVDRLIPYLQSYNSLMHFFLYQFYHLERYRYIDTYDLNLLNFIRIGK